MSHQILGRDIDNDAVVPLAVLEGIDQLADGEAATEEDLDGALLL
jgi:hypothetical protein